SYQIAQLGIGYVPENRDIFGSLTVEQNLVLGCKADRPAPRWCMEEAYALFPVLRERRDTLAGVPSGADPQQLTICRTLMGGTDVGGPDVTRREEGSEGLARQMVEVIAARLRNISERGIAILLVEQKLTIALRISHRLYVMGHGRIVFEGTPDEFRANQSVRQAWLEV